MFGFGKKEKSLEDIFVDTLRNSDIEWVMASSNSAPERSYGYSGGGFNFLFYFGTCTQDGNIISYSLFREVEKIAKESILMRDIKKAGGYILDDDLREGINNAKKILVAGEQIEMLTNLIQSIRSKYPNP